jgi:uncharacterized protein (DUF2252 family)
MRTTKITREILAQNSGRDVDRLTLKCAAMRRDPFAFFRGTNGLFLSFLPRRDRLFDAPATLVCGDLHLENFGAFKGDNRLCYFDLNDFDEACLAPFTVDLVRFIASLGIAAPGLGLSNKAARALARKFLGAYTLAVADGKARWLERSIASGVFRTLLRRAMRRTRRELLERLSRVKNGTRRLRTGKRALPATAAERAELKRFMRKLPAPGGANFMRVLDVARRVAGNGSLGLTRFVLLVRGRGSPDGNFVLDLKYAAPSAPAAWLGRAQPVWQSEAARVVTIQRAVQAIPPALLQAVHFKNGPFVLKELQPVVDRLALAQWRKKPKRIEQAVIGMAHVTAWAHLRAGGHYGAATVDAMQAYVAHRHWQPALLSMAEKATRRTEAAWREFSRDYDSGAVSAALKAAAKNTARVCKF